MTSSQQIQEQENKSPGLENTVGMASLRGIQELVKQAQEKIKEGDRQSVQTVLWPPIKNALREYTVLPRTVRRKMGLVIRKRLFEDEPINLEELISDLEAGKVKVSEKPLPPWLPQ